MSFLRSKAFHAAFGFAISGLLIFWLVISIDWQMVQKHLLGLNLFYCFPPLAIFILHYFIRSFRWRILLGDPTLSLRELFDSTIVGTLATFILPLRAGEFVRPLYLAARTDVRFMRGFVSVMVERVFDLATILGTFAILIAFLPSMPGWVYAGALSLSVLGLGLVLMLGVAAFFRQWSTGIAESCISIAPEKLRGSLHKFSQDLFDGAAVLRAEGRFWKVCGLSLLVWLSVFVFFYSFLFAFDLNPDFILAVTITVIIGLAVAAPSAPGFIGVYQTATIAAFALFSLDKEVATAYSLLTHLCQYIFFGVYGVYCLARSGLRLSELGNRSTAPM